MDHAAVNEINTDGGKQGWEGGVFKRLIEQEGDSAALKLGHIPWLALSKKISPLDARPNLRSRRLDRRGMQVEGTTNTLTCMASHVRHGGSTLILAARGF
ncbi:MAG TPA: hypothetical protein VHX12_03725 [Acidisoma sp.]|nr:hypothetical protein [Acidisoma sp.]